MRISLNWLKSWLAIAQTVEELEDILTMAGLEVDDVIHKKADFTGVVIGEVTRVHKHPDAEKLKCCQVKISSEVTLDIVCGANNVAEGIRVPVAMIGATLPGDIKIKQAKLRGALSQGMICAASELGLVQTGAGIMVLDRHAPLGEDFATYIGLPDVIYDLAITPNRGDCFSVRGIVREIGAKTGVVWHEPKWDEVKSNSDHKPDIKIHHDDCHAYSACIIAGIDMSYQTPLEIVQRLERSGLKSINYVVDVINYTMLETGQPMHAFDNDKINASGGIEVRRSNQEIFKGLDDSQKTLDSDTMVIARCGGNQEGKVQDVLAVAGVIGSLESAVSETTTSLMIESAQFNPTAISKACKAYDYHTDSSHRFERGVDPDMMVYAIKRALYLLSTINPNLSFGELVTISNGRCNKRLERGQAKATHKTIHLSPERVSKVLGIAIQDNEIESFLSPLGFTCQSTKEGLVIQVPSHRHDVDEAIDVIEEIARMIGYDKVPYATNQTLVRCQQPQEPCHEAALALKYLGYHEAITYNMVDGELSRAFGFCSDSLTLKNPLNQTMTHMRQSLLPQLVQAIKYNQDRQQSRVRLFETGVCFSEQTGKLQEKHHIAAVAVGSVAPQQWGRESREVDFYDVKGDVMSVVTQLFPQRKITLKPITDHGMLHPHQGCELVVDDESIGVMGMLNPVLRKTLGVNKPVALFEVKVPEKLMRKVVHYVPVSKYPTMVRDVAIVVEQEVGGGDIIKHIRKRSNVLLKSIELFDIYIGEGVEHGRKSLCIRLSFNDSTRTLNEDEVNSAVQAIIADLKETYNVRLR